MKGTIVKGIAGFYFVRSDDGDVIRCRARGIFKKDGVTPFVGDRVEYSVNQDGDGNVDRILPRKNEFRRPPVANVDQIVIVAAAKDPDPSFGLIDRFTAEAERFDADILICINKCDLADAGELETITGNYDGVYPVVMLSAKNGSGIAELEAKLAGRISALAGPSGAGKSTILNLLQRDEKMETGNVSDKTGRGRHTTRHAELFELPAGGMVFDTPGFTSFDVTEATEEELAGLFPDIAAYAGRCRYDNCRHLKEPGCAVREAVREGGVHRERYRSYAAQLLAIREREKNRY